MREITFVLNVALSDSQRGTERFLKDFAVFQLCLSWQDESVMAGLEDDSQEDSHRIRKDHPESMVKMRVAVDKCAAGWQDVIGVCVYGIREMLHNKGYGVL